MKMIDADAILKSQGYEQKAPSSRLVQNMDAEICRNSNCKNCGSRALIYIPYSKPGSYRAFSRCVQCDDVAEL